MNWVLVVALNCTFSNYAGQSCALKDVSPPVSWQACTQILSSVRIETTNGDSIAYCRPVEEDRDAKVLRHELFKAN